MALAYRPPRCGTRRLLQHVTPLVIQLPMLTKHYSWRLFNKHHCRTGDHSGSFLVRDSGSRLFIVRKLFQRLENGHREAKRARVRPPLMIVAVHKFSSVQFNTTYCLPLWKAAQKVAVHNLLSARAHSLTAVGGTCQSAYFWSRS